MKTKYVNLSVKTQEYLLSFLALFPEIIAWRNNIISFSYTESSSQYEEIILNLKWSLGDRFRIVSLVEKLGEEKAIEEWINLFQIKDEESFDKKLAWFDHIGTALEAHQPDFARGVKDLYKKLTASKTVHKDGVPGDIPVLIIRLSGRRDNQHSFSLFMYDHREEAFKQFSRRQ